MCSSVRQVFWLSLTKYRYIYTCGLLVYRAELTVSTAEVMWRENVAGA
jgi:hypothetical protein